MNVGTINSAIPAAITKGGWLITWTDRSDAGPIGGAEPGPSFRRSKRPSPARRRS
jgi:hypothetical protein